MSNIEYNFLNSYDNLSIVTVPLCVLNFTNTMTTTCYCGQIDTVRCYPDFNNLPSQLNFIENWGYYIDMGDGTILNGLTAFHNYKTPGSYNITLVVTDSASNLYRSADIKTIQALNLIPDSISMTYLSGNTIESSTVKNQILITRFNSFQTYPMLSATGYSINLSVSGNRSPLQTLSTYDDDKYSHLKLFSAFVKDNDILPITQIDTTVDKIYAQVNPQDNKIILGSSESFGVKGYPTVFVGTSGIAKVFYYEDFKP